MVSAVLACPNLPPKNGHEFKLRSTWGNWKMRLLPLLSFVLFAICVFQAEAAVVVLVNGEPITAHDVERRATLVVVRSDEIRKRVHAALNAPDTDKSFEAFSVRRLKANPPRTEAEQAVRIRELQAEFVSKVIEQARAEYFPAARKEALQELVAERLKMQEAQRLGVVATDSAIRQTIETMDERNAGANKKILAALGDKRTDVLGSRHSYVMAALSWRNVIHQLFGRKLSTSRFEEFSSSTLDKLRTAAQIEYR